MHADSTPPRTAELLELQVQELEAELENVRLQLDACRRSHERNLSALCAIADGIVIVDTRGRITCLNPVASHLTGWKEHAALGRSLGNVVRFIDGKGGEIDVLAEGLGSDQGGTVSLLRRDGHVVLVDGTVSPVHDSDKNPIGSVVTFRNVTASVRLIRELAYQAHHDSLTGLKNRRGFRDKLQRAITTATEFGNRNALLYIDLDQFKAVNDTGGHMAGDELLRQIAVLLRRQLREHDTVARLGGDEFAVLVENCTSAHATTVAEKIRAAIIGFEFVWSGQAFRVGASIGQVEFADGRFSALDLIGSADHLCYVAKAGGRNRVAREGDEDAVSTLHSNDVSQRPGSRREQSGS